MRQLSSICAGLYIICSLVMVADAKKLDKSAFAPSCKEPGYRVIQKLARRKGRGSARSHGKGVAVGGARFVSVVSYDKHAGFDFVVVEKAGANWTLVQRLALPTKADHAGKRESTCDRGSGGIKNAAIAFANDYDHDGKKEALVRTLFCWLVPGIGNVSVRRLFIINLDGKARIAANLQIEYNGLPTTAGHTKARYRFKDVDRDGHPDIVLSIRAEYPDDKAPKGVRIERSKRQYRYDKVRDGYQEKRRQTNK
jgi:hypothetical protein